MGYYFVPGRLVVLRLLLSGTLGGIRGKKRKAEQGRVDLKQVLAVLTCQVLPGRYLIQGLPDLVSRSVLRAPALPFYLVLLVVQYTGVFVRVPAGTVQS